MSSHLSCLCLFYCLQCPRYLHVLQAPAAGVISWKVKAGDIVETNQVLGEVIDIEDPFAARTEIRTRTAGVIFGMRSHKLSIPGTIMIKVAGEQPLSWRTGNLLTSR